jgi:carbonic anhydrase/acetyltransferase-like protein (isoleucine patch superfamily)
MKGLYPWKGTWPKLAPDVWIAPGARIVGDVEIAAGASVWFNCVVRADVNIVRIGERTNIQDGSIVHVTNLKHGTFIGSDILIGHACIIHGCELQDGCFIGMGAIVMDGCVVESGAMIAAGAMVTPDKIVRSGELWGGRPAKLLRALNDADRARMAGGVRGYAANAQANRLEYEALGLDD